MFGTRLGWSTLVKQQLELVEKKWRLLGSFHLLPMVPLLFSPPHSSFCPGSEREEEREATWKPAASAADRGNRAGACWQGSG